MHHDGEYLTDLLSQRAVAHVQRMAQQETPFFVSLHYTAPHWPWETRDDLELSNTLRRRLFHLQGGNVARYQRMIQDMDEGTGALMAALECCALAQNTLLVFTSDKGGERFSDNWPRERAKLGGLDRARLAAMRQAWMAWNETMPPLPQDAAVHLGYGAKDMPRRYAFGL